MSEDSVLVTLVPDVDDPSEKRTFTMPEGRDVAEYVVETEVVDPISFRKYWRVKDVQTIPESDPGQSQLDDRAFWE